MIARRIQQLVDWLASLDDVGFVCACGAIILLAIACGMATRALLQP